MVAGGVALVAPACRTLFYAGPVVVAGRFPGDQIEHGSDAPPVPVALGVAAAHRPPPTPAWMLVGVWSPHDPP